MDAQADKQGALPVLGSFATRRRTAYGLIAQAQLMGLTPEEMPGLLREAGLPQRALRDPEFPIALDRELFALDRTLRRLLERQQSIAGFCLETFREIGINYYGMLGLAMQHAPSLRRALESMCAYPELAWGHCRMAGRIDGERFVIAFELDVETDAALDAETLREYCVTTDLTSVQRMTADMIGSEHPPLLVRLPFRAPPGPGNALRAHPCPVEFDAEAAELVYPRTVLELEPALADELAFERYRRFAEAVSRTLAEDVGIAEQVTRLLWAHSPAPDREQIATMLGISARTLTRRLADAGTRFGTLQRNVQMERAMTDLRHGTRSVAEIAERLGYADSAAFTRAFRSWTGEAPTRWRRAQAGRGPRPGAGP